MNLKDISRDTFINLISIVLVTPIAIVKITIESGWGKTYGIILLILVIIQLAYLLRKTR